jgi:ribonuclease J
MGLETQGKLPIYGSTLTLGLIGVKLREHGLVERVEPIALEPGEQVQLGPFSARTVGVNHSIPDAVAFAIQTPLGVVFHTGDFKFDPTPVEGKTTDIEALRALGDQGVLALLSDCVRVEQPGWTPSERQVYDSLQKILADSPGRVIITTFASNIGRLRDVTRSAYHLGRRTAVAGRSMDENLRVARTLGHFSVPEDAVIELRQAQSLPQNKLALLTTGSQGEPTSVLSRMAMGEHPHVKILPEDTVVFSASPVPGNEESVARSIDNLYRRGARVIYQAINPHVHVSGHASREELKYMVRLLRPRYCIPVHGEHRMLHLYADLAEEEGVAADNVFITEIGDVVEFGPDVAGINGSIPSGSVLVDGLTVGGVTRVVLRDRRRLAADGIVIASVAVDRETGELLAGPDIIARGFAAPRDGEIMDEARVVLEQALLQSFHGEAPDYGFLVGKIREVLGSYLYEQARQRPMILPVVTEV